MANKPKRKPMKRSKRVPNDLKHLHTPPGPVKHLSDGNFDKLVLQSDKPALVDFWASWCGPCKMVAPIVEQLGEEYKDRALICKMNTEKNNAIPARYNVRSIPTLLFFKDGEIFDMVIGVRPKAYLKKILDKALAPPKKGLIGRLFSKES